ncbi:hypothetical protein OCU04_006016 [Sclerotinia nivalis]|uniref:Major facilitator superfamily (MFS) profile domain-containing protein n=1 Tax=Sclerotinia nivalis TaxID=352851 RepID=A0A9X0DIZ6_9HELO|nr:hypothetical protein OCU04_006016 [Sclerotinia nivalis]
MASEMNSDLKEQQQPPALDLSVISVPTSEKILSTRSERNTEIDESHSSSRSTSSPSDLPRSVTGARWALVVLSILSSTFLFSLDNTIVADVQPAIVRQFSSVDKLAWLPVAFLLGASGTNLFWGQIYSQFDAKYVYIICVILFEIGSATCGAAPNMDALIVGRAICGLGGAGMYSGVMVLLSVTTLEHERPIYFGLCGLTWGTGTILGPILGGAFTVSSATWRWAFYINLVVGGICSPIYLFLLPSAPPRNAGESSLIGRLKNIDFIGTLLICGCFAAGIMAVSFGGTVYTWNSGRIIGLFISAGVLLLLFVIQQAWAIGTTKSRRLFPVHFLRSPILVMMFFTTASASCAIFVPVYFIPLYFQFVRNDSALHAGIQLLPYVVFNVTTAMLNGFSMSKRPYYMPWYVLAGSLCLIGSSLMYTVNEFTSAANIWGYTILLGAGGGAFVQLSFTVCQSKVEKHEVPVAIGYCTFAQLAGPAVALCIADAVFLNDSIAGIRKLAPSLPVGTI